MSDNNLETVSSGPVDPVFWNQFRTALCNDFMGRNGLGAPEEGQKLGTAAVPWGEAHIGTLFLDGRVFDPANPGASGNSIMSGRTRAASMQPDFIRADGTASGFKILAADTPLKLNIGNAGVNIQTDLVLGSLAASPIANHTAAVNEGAIGGGLPARVFGENGTSINIDAAGSEIKSRLGQYVALKHSTEIMLAYVSEVNDGASTAVLENVVRGYFLDAAGSPITRAQLVDNAILTLLGLAWVFVQVDGTTIDVTYRSPIWSTVAPATPQVDDYWLDLNTDQWKRYNGTTWDVIYRILVGAVVMDGVNCVASRSFDFSRVFSSAIDLEVKLKSTTQVISTARNSMVSVYGTTHRYGHTQIVWDITQNLETGYAEAVDTTYYLYINEAGRPVMSPEYPVNRISGLGSYYHPYHSWRFVGACYNNAAGDLTMARSANMQGETLYYTASGEFLALPNRRTRCVLTGAGGGGKAGGNGTDGGATSLGSVLSAAGGKSGGNNGLGGVASGGQINFNGATGAISTTTTQPALGGGSYHSPPSPTTGASHGGGGASGTGDVNRTAGGGGATVMRMIQNLAGRYAITIGAAGIGGASGGSGSSGADGRDGLAILEYV